MDYLKWKEEEEAAIKARRVYEAKVKLRRHGIDPCLLSEEALENVGWHLDSKRFVVTTDPTDFMIAWRGAATYDQKLIWSSNPNCDLNEKRWDVFSKVLVEVQKNIVLYKPSLRLELREAWNAWKENH